MPRKPVQRRVCFVTGTRAEFGLMVPVLRAIEAHPALQLQIIATGMHLDRGHGRTVEQISQAGFNVDAIAAWNPFKPARKRASAGPEAGAASHLAIQAGRATAHLAAAFEKLDPEIVLVTGDRVEAFAAASAAHLSGRIVAHVHGGDRALGQVDDALRHAITKLAHVHFPATKTSAARIRKLGEDAWRIHQVGSPGIDGITRDAAGPRECLEVIGGGDFHLLGRPRRMRSCAEALGHYGLIVLHPVSADEARERAGAECLLRAAVSSSFDKFVVVYPNNDPGSGGIMSVWDLLSGAAASGDRTIARAGGRFTFARSLSRGVYLGLLRDTAVLIGNSSSGIIEAASFGTPVIDIGDRQRGRECGANVFHVPRERGPKLPALRAALEMIWNGGKPRRFRTRNVYGNGRTGEKIAAILANLTPNDALRRKLIAY